MLVSLVVMVGMLVTVPPGLRLVEPPGTPGGAWPSGRTALRRLWPAPAALGALARRAASHGVGKALGLALCSILALRRLKESTV